MFTEGNDRERLCEHVRDIGISSYVFNNYLTSCDRLSDEMVLDINVFCTLVINRVFSQCNGSLIINLKLGCFKRD